MNPPRRARAKNKLAKANLDIGKSRFTNWQKTMSMTPNPTKEEIEALELEIQKKRKRAVRTAVNPERQYAG